MQNIEAKGGGAGGGGGGGHGGGGGFGGNSAHGGGHLGGGDVTTNPLHGPTTTLFNEGRPTAVRFTTSGGSSGGGQSAPINGNFVRPRSPYDRSSIPMIIIDSDFALRPLGFGVITTNQRASGRPKRTSDGLYVYPNGRLIKH